jgi:hypothetical protein
MLLFLLPILFAGDALSKVNPKVWIFIMEPVWRDINKWPPSDFARLADETLWSTVLDNIDVFQFSEKYAAHADISELKALVSLFNRHGVQIAVQGVALVANQRCGLGVEGYGTEDETRFAAHRLEEAGAKVSYIVFDEPLLFGHFFRGKIVKGCQLGIVDILKQVVDRENSLRAAFPGVLIGDSEPFGLNGISTEVWRQAYKEWLLGYKWSTGHEWDFIQADIVWSNPNWKDQLTAILPEFTARSIPFGVFYTGIPSDRNDSDWSSTILANIESFHKSFKLVTQQAIFASWTDIPRRALPETNPDTVTGTILRYLQRRR